MLLIVSAISCLPWPTYVKYVLNAAEVDLYGNVIATGEMLIEGWIYTYVFQQDSFKLTCLQIPNQQVDKVYAYSYALMEMYSAPGNYHTYALVKLRDYSSNSVTEYICNIFFSGDQSVWIVEMKDRIFVGTTKESPDYIQEMEFWGKAINGFIENEGFATEPVKDSPNEDILGAIWDMTAAVVDAQGQTLETVDLTAKVKVWEQEGEVCYALNFLYPENIYNSVTGVVPNAEQGKPYNCCAGTGVETGEAGKRGPSLYIAFDYIKGCFMADFDDGKDVYLIAYKNPNEEVSAIWAYFQDFIQMRPEEFPKAY